MSDLVLAMTGASGTIYAVRLLEVLRQSGRRVHLTISPSAVQVCQRELGRTIDLADFDISQLLGPPLGPADEDPLRSYFPTPMAASHNAEPAAEGRIRYHHYQDFSAGIASGSFRTGGMVICPCSMGTLGAIANGLSSNLIHRAADVHLKERRKLIVVPRETPLGSIQLANMKQLADAGAVVLPAMPGFYHQPSGMGDLVDFVVGRICDQLGVDTTLFERWGEREDTAKD